MIWTLLLLGVSVWGQEAYDVLDQSGLAVVVEFPKGQRTPVHVVWPALETVAENADTLLAFAGLYGSARSRWDPAWAPDPRILQKVRALPSSVLVPPSLRLAVAVLELQGRNAAGPPAGAGELLFDQPWPQPFLEAIHASGLDDFRTHAEAYFQAFLTGPGGAADGAPHFLGYLLDVYKKDGSELLQDSQSSGRASPELAGWVAKYLLDQRRLWTTSRTAPRLKTLEAATSLSQDVEALRAVAQAVRDSGGLAAMRKAAELPAEGKAAFRGTELYLRGAGRPPGSSCERVEASAAYWVDGIGSDERIEVSEAAFVQTGGSVVERSHRVVERGVGGPYAFNAVWTSCHEGPADYHLLLRSPGKAPYHLTTRQDGNAPAPPPAETAAPAVPSWDCPPGSAPAGDLTEARQDASPERCRFKTDSAERALAALRLLPPSCDRLRLGPEGILGQELRGLFWLTARRRLNTEASAAYETMARALEGRCDFSGAARAYASAMAMLESDPGACCGQGTRDFARLASQDLPRARAAVRMVQALDEKLAAAEALDPADMLLRLAPLALALDGKPCYKDQAGRASGLLKAAAGRLSSSAAALPQDDAAAEVAAVKAEVERLAEAEALRSKDKTAREAPFVPEPAEPGGAP